jgi:hypothetical protein
MSTFNVVSPPAALPDPAKHVNYTQGMVLGVDDFNQEFAYHAGHLRWLAHGLIGYGTVRGLRVSINPDPSAPQVVVSAGNAVSPLGHLICVPQPQCARLDDWLAANQADLLPNLGSPLATTAHLYVVLSYAETPVDLVPIPGEPCRSETDTMAPSRLADDFRLELIAVPPKTVPDQHEEDAVRDLLALLSQVQITDVAGTFTSLDQFLAAIRALGQPLTSPLGSPIGSPLAALRIHPADVPQFFAAALRVWITEVRPPWTIGTPPEDRLLLAELDVPLQQAGPGGPWVVSAPGSVLVYEERRPFLVPLRLLQEWLLHPPGSAGGPAAGTVVAAGRFPASGTPPAFSFGGLTARQLGGAVPLYLLEFPAFQPGRTFLTKGSTLAAVASAGSTFHVVAPTDPALGPGIFPPGKGPTSGIVVRSQQTTGAAAFAVEISQY